MDIYEKYDLDKEKSQSVKELPQKLDAFIYILEGKKPGKSFYVAKFGYVKHIPQEPYELYMNIDGKLKHISTNESYFSPVLLFLKTYRDDKKSLPTNVQDLYSGEIETDADEKLRQMQFLIEKPINTFEEFKERLLEATEKIPSEFIIENNYRYGDRYVFVKKREEFGKVINIYDEYIPVAKELNDKYWEKAILFDRENNIFEYWYKEERTNDDEQRTNWSLEIKFYEEKYLYEYLLNRAISAVVYDI